MNTKDVRNKIESIYRQIREYQLLIEDLRDQFKAVQRRCGHELIEIIEDEFTGKKTSACETCGKLL
jgi:hypothetical protein